MEERGTNKTISKSNKSGWMNTRQKMKDRKGEKRRIRIKGKKY